MHLPIGKDNLEVDYIVACETLPCRVKAVAATVEEASNNDSGSGSSAARHGYVMRPKGHV